jgi:hypothetical protein
MLVGLAEFLSTSPLAPRPRFAQRDRGGAARGPLTVTVFTVSSHCARPNGRSSPLAPLRFAPRILLFWGGRFCFRFAPVHKGRSFLCSVWGGVGIHACFGVLSASMPPAAILAGFSAGVLPAGRPIGGASRRPSPGRFNPAFLPQKEGLFLPSEKSHSFLNAKVYASTLLPPIFTP